MLTGGDISLSVSRKFSDNLKENFLNHKQKHNVSLKLWHEVNTKKLDYFLVDNKQEPWYGSKPSACSKTKQSYFQYLNSMTPFLLSLVIYFVGSWFKILRMSWYKFMTPFWDNLQLVINKYLFCWHDSFPVIKFRVVPAPD